MHDGLHLLAHIIILVVERHLHYVIAVFAGEQVGHLLDVSLARLKLLAVVVADDVGQGGVLHTALHANQVVETFVLNGVLGGFAFGKESGKLGGHACGVNHLVLGIAGVHADTRDFYAGRGSVEVLKLQLAQFAAVHRVGPFATETLYIEFVRA